MRTATRNGSRNGNHALKPPIGAIKQICSNTVFNKEADRDLVIIYALTEDGQLYEYLSGSWVKLNALAHENVKLVKDGKLVDA